jgi:hypothetical protein
VAPVRMAVYTFFAALVMVHRNFVGAWCSGVECAGKSNVSTLCGWVLTEKRGWDLILERNSHGVETEAAVLATMSRKIVNVAAR